LRVLELTQRFPPALGGVEAHVDQLTTELARVGLGVEVATTDLARDRPFTRVPSSANARAFPVRRHRAFELLRAPHGLGIVSPGLLLDALGSRPDVIHAHAFGYFPTWVGAIRRRLDPIPLVVSPHCDAGKGTTGSGRYGRAVARWTVRVADRVVALTALERELLTSWGIPSSSITVIPNGIHLSEFANPRLPAERTDVPPTILFVGRLYSEQKGLFPLLRAFARLPPDLGAHLRLVGEDWGAKPALTALAGKLGVSDRLWFLGALDRSALLDEYRTATVFTLPSLFEPFGIVLLEAMAAGLPIVASRVGGVPALIQDGKTGVLVPPGDVDALSGALEGLLRDRGLRSRLAKGALEQVQAYDWAVLTPRWVELFEEVLDGR
jgi:glycosyltransferase involved in cell wall biosynthesis